MIAAGKLWLRWTATRIERRERPPKPKPAATRSRTEGKHHGHSHDLPRVRQRRPRNRALVAARLGYAYEDRVTLLAALRAADPIWERFGDEYDEHKPSLWERFDWSYRGYSALLQRHLLEAAAADRVVIVGRGGAFLLAGVPTALHVRIVAPLAERIERIMRREHADHDSVRALIERIDPSAPASSAHLPPVVGRPGSYDVTCDTSLLEQAAIVEECRALAVRDRADRRRSLLAWPCRRPRARRALHRPHLQLPTLEVREQGEGILVQGVLHQAGEKLPYSGGRQRPRRGLSGALDLRYRYAGRLGGPCRALARRSVMFRSSRKASAAFILGRG